MKRGFLGNLLFLQTEVPVLSLVLVLIGASAFGAQPLRFNYQAKLSDTIGTPLQGQHNLFVTLWDGGTSGTANSGTSVYAETAAVTVTNGIANHTVGTGTPSGPALTDGIFSSS